MDVKPQLHWQNENSTSSRVRLRTGEASTLVDEKLGASGTSEGTKTAGEIGCASVCGGACG